MSYTFIMLVLVALTAFGFLMGRRQGVGFRTADHVHSLPNYHGAYVALIALLPAALVFLLWIAIEPMVADSILRSQLQNTLGLTENSALNLAISQVKGIVGGVNVAGADETLQKIAAEYGSFRTNAVWLIAGIVLVVAAAGLWLSYGRLDPLFRARNRVEKIVRIIMIAASLIAILTTVGIVLSLLFETVRFFGKVPVSEFLFGLKWSPQTALRAEQVGASGAFGAVPLFAGTMLITVIAMCVAVPVGLLSAIYMSEYATPRFRAVAKPILEILAGIPTVVYGFFAALIVAPMFRDVGESIGLTVASESALAAGIVMGLMIIPFVSSLSDDVMTAVPQSLREGSYGLGATRSETIKQVIFPAALPGIVGSILLAVSRAIGETMIVVMAAGLAANLTANPLEAVTTVTVQMVTLLVGDQEFDSAKTLAAFALGLLLFSITLLLNVIALKVVQRYRERYD